MLSMKAKVNKIRVTKTLVKSVRMSAKDAHDYETIAICNSWLKLNARKKLKATIYGHDLYIDTKNKHEVELANEALKVMNSPCQIRKRLPIFR